MTAFNSTSRKPNLFRKSTALAVLFALGGAPVWANNLTVNNLNDITSPGDGKCTLREAIANANANSDTTGLDCVAGTGADTITFSVGGTIELGSTLSINDAAGLTLDGVGQSVIVSGNYSVRVILVNPGATLTVKNLTVANGFDPSIGGGIVNQSGILNIVNCTFSGNRTSGNGGGIAHYSNSTSTNPGNNLTVVNSTFSGNSAFYGGAIWNGYGGPISLINSTIVGNSAITPVCPAGFVCAQIIAEGGGISNSSLGPNLVSGILNLENSIVAGNTNIIKRANLPDLTSPSDINGYVTGGSYNLIGNQAGIFSGLQNGVNGNIIGIDAATVLATILANNGGPTQTLALLPGSLAINTALATNCPATDQRGVVRPQGPACDIGAFEVAVVATADLAITETATPNPTMVRDSLTWKINVTNTGTANATGVKVIDTLPASGLTSIKVSASQGSCGAASSGVITCNLGNLANGISANVTVSGIPTTAGTLTNQVIVSGDQLDGQLANNTATQSTPVQALLCNGLTPIIVGTTGPDLITGTQARDIIHGLSGNDTISGGNDNDIICGGEGQDTLKGDSGNDALNGGGGTDSCNGGKGTDSAANCEAKTGIP